jgi:hypothetical protein
VPSGYSKSALAPGFFSTELARRPQGRLELFDVHPEMLDKARHSLARVLRPGGLLVFVEAFPDPDRLSVSFLRQLVEPEASTSSAAMAPRGVTSCDSGGFGCLSAKAAELSPTCPARCHARTMIDRRGFLVLSAVGAAAVRRRARRPPRPRRSATRPPPFPRPSA